MSGLRQVLTDTQREVTVQRARADRLQVEVYQHQQNEERLQEQLENTNQRIPAPSVIPPTARSGYSGFSMVDLDISA